MNRRPPFRKLARTISDNLIRFPLLHAPLRAAFTKLPTTLRGPILDLDSFRKLARETNPIFFLQIGANDGEQDDPICNFVKAHKWKGILVEPVPKYFDSLKSNYASIDGLVFENIAISDSSEPKNFYYLDDSTPNLPKWAKGLGSFYKENIVTLDIPGINFEDDLRTIEVPCISLDKLLEKYGNPKIDLLLIDTQGFDGQIIKQIEFTKIRPRLIMFEHELLSPEEKSECRTILEAV